MGCRYYAEQRLVYDDEMSVMRQLRALDKTEPINSFVRMAVDGVEANPMALYNIETPFSQRNVVAILRGDPQASLWR